MRWQLDSTLIWSNTRARAMAGCYLGDEVDAVVWTALAILAAMSLGTPI